MFKSLTHDHGVILPACERGKLFAAELNALLHLWNLFPTLGEREFDCSRGFVQPRYMGPFSGNKQRNNPLSASNIKHGIATSLCTYPVYPVTGLLAERLAPSTMICLAYAIAPLITGILRRFTSLVLHAHQPHSPQVSITTLSAG